MQLSSATHSQHYNLLPRQAYSNGTNRPQADTSEIMSRIRLSSLKSIFQVSVTRTEREVIYTVPMESLMPPTLTTCSRICTIISICTHITSSVPSCSILLAFRAVLSSPRSSTAQSSAGRQLSLSHFHKKGSLSRCWKPSLSWPSSSPTILPSLGWLFTLLSEAQLHLDPAIPGGMAVPTQLQPAAQAAALIHVLEVAWFMIRAPHGHV